MAFLVFLIIEASVGANYKEEKQMINTKKAMAKTLILAFVVSLFAMTTALAQECTTQDDNLRYIGISTLNASLSIDDNGKANCTGSVTLNNSGYSADLTMELIQVDTGRVLKTWTASGATSIRLTNKPWYVTNGHEYQVKVTVTVYNASDRVIETTEEVSDIREV